MRWIRRNRYSSIPIGNWYKLFNRRRTESFTAMTSSGFGSPLSTTDHIYRRLSRTQQPISPFLLKWEIEFSVSDKSQRYAVISLVSTRMEQFAGLIWWLAVFDFLPFVSKHQYNMVAGHFPLHGTMRANWDNEAIHFYFLSNDIYLPLLLMFFALIFAVALRNKPRKMQQFMA